MRGLDGAFIARGARAIVSSLWAVDDSVAAAFSTLLHSSLAEGYTTAAAFREAAGYMHSDGWRSTASSSAVLRAEGLLDGADPGWRSALDDATDHDPNVWAALKVSGYAFDAVSSV
jgi:CHAT domain-containing protein